MIKNTPSRCPILELARIPLSMKASVKHQFFVFLFSALNSINSAQIYYSLFTLNYHLHSNRVYKIEKFWECSTQIIFNESCSAVFFVLFALDFVRHVSFHDIWNPGNKNAILCTFEFTVHQNISFIIGCKLKIRFALIVQLVVSIDFECNECTRLIRFGSRWFLFFCCLFLIVPNFSKNLWFSLFNSLCDGVWLTFV